MKPTKRAFFQVEGNILLQWLEGYEPWLLQFALIPRFFKPPPVVSTQVQLDYF
jgi:hypothetical protein